MRIEPITQVGTVQSVTQAQRHTQEARPAARAEDAPRETTGVDLAVAARSFNEAAEPYGFSLLFSRDDETGATVIRVVDSASGEVVRQIPQEALLRLSAALGKLQGHLFARTA